MRSLMRSLAVVAVLLVAGCSGGGAADSGAVESTSQKDSNGAYSDMDGAAADESMDLAEPSFVTSGSVSMVVDDPAETAAEAARLVEAAGGHVQERVEQGGADDDAASAYLVVRIPSDEVSGTLEELKQLGDVQDTSLVSTEVTDQVEDLEARIRALEISIGRLEELLTAAGSISEIVEAEQILTERQSELEVLLSQQASLADEVAMSTFRLDIWSEGAEPEEPATGFWAGLTSGWAALVSTVNGLLQGLGALLPWLVVAGIIAWIVLVVRRALSRRRAATAPPSAPSSPGGPTTSLPVAAPQQVPYPPAGQQPQAGQHPQGMQQTQGAQQPHGVQQTQAARPPQTAAAATAPSPAAAPSAPPTPAPAAPDAAAGQPEPADPAEGR